MTPADPWPKFTNEELFGPTFRHGTWRCQIHKPVWRLDGHWYTFLALMTYGLPKS